MIKSFFKRLILILDLNSAYMIELVKTGNSVLDHLSKTHCIFHSISNTLDGY